MADEKDCDESHENHGQIVLDFPTALVFQPGCASAIGAAVGAFCAADAVVVTPADAPAQSAQWTGLDYLKTPDKDDKYLRRYV